jgi:hypothetical protein
MWGSRQLTKHTSANDNKISRVHSRYPTWIASSRRRRLQEKKKKEGRQVTHGELYKPLNNHAAPVPHKPAQ